MCKTYLWATMQMMVANSYMLEKLTVKDSVWPDLYGTSACFSDIVTAGAMQQAFLNWAEKNPTSWSRPTSVGVTAAFSLAWPCPVQ